MTQTTAPASRTAPETQSNLLRPKLGFLGVGWIGLNRLEAIAKSGAGEITAIADPSPDMIGRAQGIAPGATVKHSLAELLELELDGLVIATPSALHAEQALTALSRGIPVFCQKPLGRNALETESVIAAARGANRLLAVDLSYRFLTGVQRMRELIQGGELGNIYAVEMAFHNAYGPDKGWFYNRKLSGGGCVMDLGIHLVDLALWLLGFPRVVQVSSRLFARGEPWHGEGELVEDYATARLDVDTGASVQLACSWKLPAGRDAIIQAAFYGTRGGVALHNVDGSFFEFAADRFQGTTREALSSGIEDWGGRAAKAWASRLAQKETFDPEIEHLTTVSEALDQIYRQQRA
jgi:predicted dehydrogenase